MLPRAAARLKLQLLALLAEKRPTCIQSGLGYWLEQSAPNDRLQPAELDYAKIVLSYEGVAWAQLAKVDGSGAAAWPQLLPAVGNNQCSCCKLCTAQNVAALVDATGTTPIQCKRWSYRARDGVCRLFGPGGGVQRSVSLQSKSAKDQEWASGTAERYVALLSPAQVAPGTAKCQFITTGSSGMPAGLGGGSSLRSPPPPKPSGASSRPSPPPPLPRKIAQPVG